MIQIDVKNELLNLWDEYNRYLEIYFSNNEVPSKEKSKFYNIEFFFGWLDKGFFHEDEWFD